MAYFFLREIFVSFTCAPCSYQMTECITHGVRAEVKIYKCSEIRDENVNRQPHYTRKQTTICFLCRNVVLFHISCIRSLQAWRNMLIGIVGKPNVGKSTFFKAATLAEVEIANYPFATIKPNSGVG